ncbi:hypothetical protein HHK36_019802 [Tetracentron sinense]|uniref:Uncharacterized protein n=1 Tax=Tetracentron sinense TaxID=13715 RepID=A0A835D9X7_TETSI|nr:hypothetical protein HHK36_019802 [Tetracentron sinense]
MIETSAYTFVLEVLSFSQMAPTSRRRRRGRRIQYKQQLHQSSNQETSTELPSNSITTSSIKLLKIDGKDDSGVDMSTDGCSTPKGQRFRIPKILPCPPAPKKRRVASNCSSKRSPIAFFAPPDLELFFFALRHISV